MEGWKSVMSRPPKPDNQADATPPTLPTARVYTVDVKEQGCESEFRECGVSTSSSSVFVFFCKRSVKYLGRGHEDIGSDSRSCISSCSCWRVAARETKLHGRAVRDQSMRLYVHSRVETGMFGGGIGHALKAARTKKKAMKL